MSILISDNLTEVIQEQLGHERYNAAIYLFVAGYLKNKGLNNLGKIFYEQHDEEIGHSKMIFELLTDMNADVKIPETLPVNIPINDIREIAKLYLEREIITTTSLDEIKKLAIDENNPVVEEFMRKMIKLQRKEYEEALDFMDKAEITGGDWKFVLMWDLGLE